MKEIYDAIDKSEWLDGSWKNEPDRIYWIDEYSGYPCLIWRSSGAGSLCGYVAVPSIHPYYKSSYDDVPVEVHGGLTYASSDSEQEIKEYFSGLNLDEYFWFGFDCAHWRDYMPVHEYIMGKIGGPIKSDNPYKATYKDINYVKSETTLLAKQLYEIKDMPAKGFKTAEEHDKEMEEFIKNLPEINKKLKKELGKLELKLVNKKDNNG